ncbi:hypothetical protein KEF29_06445 [Streptomyces tuirus]|uniref:Uncharacterized protein n=1 Tax=Streptomyces tuirus TaxID=68278 RepID=A0A941J245_9ACTN|nr:hypothetical protein [Streptomyces tuirus]
MAVFGTVLVVAAVVVLVRVMESWPHPPPAGTTSRAQAHAHMRQDALRYADVLATADRAGPLTQERLRTLPTPAGLAIGTATVTERGPSTVVTFSTHATYGSPDRRTGTTACYQATLPPDHTSPTVAEVPTTRCDTPPDGP